MEEATNESTPKPVYYPNPQTKEDVTSVINKIVKENRKAIEEENKK